MLIEETPRLDPPVGVLAESVGERNELGELLQWCLVTKGPARAPVKTSLEFAKIGGGMLVKLVAAMNELAARHPRYDYRRAWALLRTDGWEANRKRIERLWR